MPSKPTTLKELQEQFPLPEEVSSRKELWAQLQLFGVIGQIPSSLHDLCYDDVADPIKLLDTYQLNYDLGLLAVAIGNAAEALGLTLNDPAPIQPASYESGDEWLALMAKRIGTLQTNSNWLFDPEIGRAQKEEILSSLVLTWKILIQLGFCDMAEVLERAEAPLFSN